MFKSEIDFKSNPSKTGYICMEINPLPKKIQASLKFSMKFLYNIRMQMSSSLPHIHKLPLWLEVFLSNPRSYYPDEQECKALKKLME